MRACCANVVKFIKLFVHITKSCISLQEKKTLRFSCHHVIRPWYVEALTPEAKDVVILLDVSESMRTDTSGNSNNLAMAKTAVIAVLSTLSPRDRVNRLYYL